MHKNRQHPYTRHTYYVNNNFIIWYGIFSIIKANSLGVYNIFIFTTRVKSNFRKFHIIQHNASCYIKTSWQLSLLCVYSRKMTDSDVMLIDFGIALFNFQCARPASNIKFKAFSVVNKFYAKIHIAAYNMMIYKIYPPIYIY